MQAGLQQYNAMTNLPPNKADCISRAQHELARIACIGSLPRRLPVLIDRKHNEEAKGSATYAHGQMNVSSPEASQPPSP